MNKEELILTIIRYALIGNIIVLMLWFTFQDQIFGIDSWYWANVSGFSIPMVNISIIVFIWVVAHYFDIGEVKKRNALILSIVFLSSFFMVRFIEFEVDDMLFFFISAFGMLIYPKKAWVIGIGAVLFYVFINGFYTFNFYNQEVFLEQVVDYTKILYLVPSLYLFLHNRKWSYIALIVGLFLIFPIPKFVSSAIPLVLLALFLRMKDLELKADWILLMMLALSSIVFLWQTSLWYVDQNILSENLCNPTTLICDNSEISQKWHGHYLSYKGYSPTSFPSQSYTPEFFRSLR